MNVLSLFDGMSCGQIALNRAGIKYDNYFASEVDKYAIQITQKNFPNTIQLGDVSKIDADSLPTIDMLIGGSPCQSFSFAGKRKGMTTKDNIEILNFEDYLNLKNQGFEFEGQSYLFWEYIRLLKKVKPKYFLLENVKMDKKWKNLISEILEVEPIFINSNLFSAQNRQRYYWTNIKVDQIKTENNIVLEDIVDQDLKELQLTKKHHEAFLKSYAWKHCELHQKSKPILASYYKQPPHCPYIKSDISESGFRRLSPLECERLQTVPDNYTAGVSNMQRYKMLGNGWTIDVIAFIFKHISGKIK
jgi:DNA-cytosine methyltransferase